MTLHNTPHATKSKVACRLGTTVTFQVRIYASRERVATEIRKMIIHGCPAGRKTNFGLDCSRCLHNTNDQCLASSCALIFTNVMEYLMSLGYTLLTYAWLCLWSPLHRASKDILNYIYVVPIVVDVMNFGSTRIFSSHAKPQETLKRYF
jgi:hypothetical protein